MTKARVNETGIYVESCVTSWMAQNTVLLTRVALGLIFFWFGILKFFPGESDATELAAKTISTLCFGLVSHAVSIPILASWECLIGVGLLAGKFLRVTLVLLFLQMPGTFLPLIFFPSETWNHFPYSPTLLGQYIIKNLVLLCAGLLVGATMRGGKVIADPHVAVSAGRVQRVADRFRRRFRLEPRLNVQSARRSRS